MKTILLSLPLPRAHNRRRGFANWNFVRWFNAEAQCYAREVSQLCRGVVLGRRNFYIDHGFLSLPTWRFVTADVLHTCFEGVAILAQHFKERLRYHRPRWASTLTLITHYTDEMTKRLPRPAFPPVLRAHHTRRVYYVRPVPRSGCSRQLLHDTPVQTAGVATKPGRRKFTSSGDWCGSP
ncbi:hypothetical protein HPB48_001704 [Haemaphysalis longicornis]|uniref:Uncharacterized protein n=1 Tax=Haemaphysalis longicornis TaxID=44386 RepID=A0A9J6GK12_HAELO|nr:hypothetical protein HPB48_001704 [Haemaphysalis longicornis]